MSQRVKELGGNPTKKTGAVWKREKVFEIEVTTLHTNTKLAGFHLSGESGFLLGLGFTTGGTFSCGLAVDRLVVSGSLTDIGTTGLNINGCLSLLGFGAFAGMNLGDTCLSLQ